METWEMTNGAADCPLCALVDGADSDPRIFAAGSHFVAALYEDQSYPFRSLVAHRTHFTEIEDVPQYQQHEIYDFVIRTGVALKRVTGATLINYAVLQNRVAHFHWHVIPRSPGDHQWGEAPWPHPKEIVTDRQTLTERARLITEALSDDAQSSLLSGGHRS
jgi:diadenosine tetraphosphate (Ap4A) HIT family hydrolase